MLDSSYVGALVDQSSCDLQSSLPRCQCKWKHLEPSWPCRPTHPLAKHLSGLCLSMLHGAEEYLSCALLHAWPTKSWDVFKTVIVLSISQSSRCSHNPRNGPQICMWPCPLFLSDLIFDIPLAHAPPATLASLFFLGHTKHAPSTSGHLHSLFPLWEPPAFPQMWAWCGPLLHKGLCTKIN